MKWTRDVPTEPGWFWVRGTATEDDRDYALCAPIPLLNEPDKDFQGTVAQKASAYRYYGVRFGYGPLEFSGPITPPPT